MIGCAPATRASLAAGAGDGSDTVGLNGGRAAATRVSAGFGAAGFATTAVGRGRSFASVFGLAATAVAVVSLDRPTLRARLEKKPPDFGSGVADATRVVVGT